jgi:hypothetical protein
VGQDGEGLRESVTMSSDFLLLIVLAAVVWFSLVWFGLSIRSIWFRAPYSLERCVHGAP